MIKSEIKATDARKKILACLLLFFLFSFLGWGFEKIMFLVAYGVNADRGFLSLPFCTIYGSALILIRVVLGLPDVSGYEYPYNLLRFLFYAVAAASIATAVELVTGLFFEEVFHVRLWTYADYAHVYRNYICLPVSIAWGVMIATAMTAVWQPLESAFSKLSLSFLGWSVGLLSLAVALDFFLTAFL
jgi:uncharacterized membrane protein